MNSSLDWQKDFAAGQIQWLEGYLNYLTEYPLQEEKFRFNVLYGNNTLHAFGGLKIPESFQSNEEFKWIKQIFSSRNCNYLHQEEVGNHDYYFDYKFFFWLIDKFPNNSFVLDSEEKMGQFLQYILQDGNPNYFEIRQTDEIWIRSSHIDAFLKDVQLIDKFLFVDFIRYRRCCGDDQELRWEPEDQRYSHWQDGKNPYLGEIGPFAKKNLEDYLISIHNKPKRIINILFLSDLHFGISPSDKITEEAISQRNQVLDDLIKYLKAPDSIAAHSPPDYAVISGDIAWSGKVEEYEEAWVWLNRLLSIPRLDRSKLILCPGNHDFNWKLARPTEKPPTQRTDVENLLNIKNIEEISVYFHNFIESSEKYKSPSYKIKSVNNHLIGCLDFPGIRFVVLNSCWFCFEKNIGAVCWIGYPFLRDLSIDLLDKKDYNNPNKPIVISILHHPESYFHEEEIHPPRQFPNSFEYLATRSHIILTGHEHPKLPWSPDRKYARAWVFRGGAAYSGPQYWNYILMLTINIDNRTVHYTPIIYDPGIPEWRAAGPSEEYPLTLQNVPLMTSPRIEKEEIAVEIIRKTKTNTPLKLIFDQIDEHFLTLGIPKVIEILEPIVKEGKSLSELTKLLIVPIFRRNNVTGRTLLRLLCSEHRDQIVAKELVDFNTNQGEPGNDEIAACLPLIYQKSSLILPIFNLILDYAKPSRLQHLDLRTSINLLIDMIQKSPEPGILTSSFIESRQSFKEFSQFEPEICKAFQSRNISLSPDKEFLKFQDISQGLKRQLEEVKIRHPNLFVGVHNYNTFYELIGIFIEFLYRFTVSPLYKETTLEEFKKLNEDQIEEKFQLIFQTFFRFRIRDIDFLIESKLSRSFVDYTIYGYPIECKMRRKVDTDCNTFIELHRLKIAEYCYRLNKELGFFIYYDNITPETAERPLYEDITFLYGKLPLDGKLNFTPSTIIVIRVPNWGRESSGRIVF